jgi:HlyD family secretion protein
MTATAAITATERANVLLVPNTALRFSPRAALDDAAAKKSSGISLLPTRMPGTNRKSAAASASTALARQVWVLRDGQAVAVSVAPGISDGRMTEITSGALQAGMLVITDQQAVGGP